MTKAEVGSLIISEFYHPAWKAKIDGKRVDIDREHEILRGVKLDSGLHDVVLRFLPDSFLVGMIISLVGWLAFIFLEISYRFKLGVIKR